jgi:enoyl-CoA hydratase
MLLGAEVLTAEDGFRYGFVQTLGGLSDAQQLASRIADLAPLSLAGTKLGLNLVDTLAESPEYTEAFRRAWDSEDLTEGRAAFAERRSPVFRGI